MGGVWNWIRKSITALSLAIGFLMATGQGQPKAYIFYDDRASNGQPGTELVIGDSIACGIGAAGELETDCKIGLSPKAVYARLLTHSKESLKGRIVILSAGVSNDPAQIEYVAKDLEYLNDAGAKVVILGVGFVIDGGRINRLLGSYADNYGWIAIAGWTEVHPGNYHMVVDFIREAECKVWRICAV